MTRRALAWLLTLLIPITGVVAAEVGAWQRVANDRDAAAAMRARGDYAGAYGLNRALDQSSGPLYLLARHQVDDLSSETAATLTAWTVHLAAAGQVDAALAVLSRAEADGDPAGLDLARLRARLILNDAQAATVKGNFVTALGRLDQLTALHPPADIARASVGLRPTAELGDVAGLLAADRPGEAVAALDDAASHGSEFVARANALLPVALLADARQLVVDLDWLGAAARLQRVISAFPDSPEAVTAAAMLAAPQPVGGTVVRKNGTPLGYAAVRLGSHFQRFGAGYRTSGPFFTGSADASGNFRIDGVPVGGPYVLEVFDGDWTTLVDNGVPAQPVTVAPLQPSDLSFVVLPS